MGIVRQVESPELTDLLRTIYALGSQIGTPIAEAGLGRTLADDFARFILAAANRSLEGASVLEIGSGRGYLLCALQELGAQVMGVEPGLACSPEAEAAGIPVMHEEFEACDIEGSFDLVIHHGVLEHVPDPVPFLRRQMGLLREGGAIVAAVPDCSEFVAHGDISMFVHEHWSYFTEPSVATLASAIGARLSLARKAGVGGGLYCSFTSSAFPAGVEGGAGEAVELEQFPARVDRAVGRFRELATELIQNHESFGVFCPGRFLNYCLLVSSWPAELRFFDDDPTLAGKYFPPLPFPVETRDALLAKPVDTLLIMSRAFGHSIQSSLQDEPALGSTRVVTLGELF